MKKYFLLLVFLTAGTILFQGFQCASPEMTTAKMALQQKDYEKAEEFLKKEVRTNAMNEQAWILLIETQLNFLGKPMEAVENIKDAEGRIKQPEYLQRMPQLKYLAWITCYDSAVARVQKYIRQPEEAKNTKLIDEALSYLNKGIEAAPDQPKLFYLKGFAYERAGNLDKAVEVYEKFKELYAGEIKLAEKGLRIDMNRKDAIDLLGAPNYSFGRRFSLEGDSILTDQFLVDYKRAFVFSSEVEPGKFEVFGWRYDPPKNWTKQEREYPDNVILTPFEALTEIYYSRKKYDESLENVQILLDFDPANINANAYLVELYEIKGQPEEALKSIASLVEKEPENKLYRAQYGDMLYKLNKYNEAIKQYEKAMEIDPNFYEVARNLAAAYKNQAVEIQKKQRDKAEKNPEYEPDKSEFEPLLKKSEKFFLKSMESPNFRNDVDVIVELVNIYEVLDMEQKFKQQLAKLEALEAIVPKEKKENYYLNLFRIYDRHGQVEKREEVEKKIEALD